MNLWKGKRKGMFNLRSLRRPRELGFCYPRALDMFSTPAVVAELNCNGTKHGLMSLFESQVGWRYNLYTCEFPCLVQTCGGVARNSSLEDRARD